MSTFGGSAAHEPNFRGARAPRRARRPGLKPWVFGLLWFLFCFHGLYSILMSVNEPLTSARVTQDLDALEAFAQDPAPLKIALMGNSMLRYATWSAETLDEAARERGIDLASVRLLNNNATFLSFSHALEPLIAAQPDLIIIQAPLLLLDNVMNRDNFKLVQQYLRWRLLGGTMNGVDPIEVQSALGCARDLSPRMHALWEDRLARRRNYDPTGANARAADAFVERARANGIRVVAVTAPVAAALQPFLTSLGGVAMQSDALFSRVDSGWPFPYALLASEHEQPEQRADIFCDPIHLADQGRAIYSDWLIDKVARWREANLLAQTRQR